MKECHLPIGKRVLVESAQTHAKVYSCTCKIWFKNIEDPIPVFIVKRGKKRFLVKMFLRLMSFQQPVCSL